MAAVSVTSDADRRGRGHVHALRFVMVLLAAALGFAACSSVAPPAQAAATCGGAGNTCLPGIGDDYPYKNYPIDGGSGYGGYYRECTDFVAWRLNRDGAPGWYAWGNANQWDDTARAKGVRVDRTPALGAVAQWESTHVAYVAGTNADGSQIFIEEYNYGYDGRYNARWIPASSPSNYLHVHDLAPAGASPFGYLDAASSPAAGVLRVAGWTADADAPTQSIDVHVYANSTGFNLGPANQKRDDVAGAYPGYGSSHGFSADLSLPSGGSYKVCAFGINVGGGSNQPLRDCKQVQVADPQPFGYLDQVSSSTPGTITVRGWAVDPSSPRTSIDVHAYMDQKFLGATTANQRRDDVDKALTGYGPLHGYTATFPAAAGSHRVCTYAINIGVGDNRELKECKSVTVTAPPAPAPAPPAPRTAPAPVAAAAPGALTTSRFRSPRRGVAILSWAPASNASSYRFRISWPNRSKKWTGWATTSNTWMKVTRLKRGAKYQFQVQAISSGGQSPVKQWWFIQRR